MEAYISVGGGDNEDRPRHGRLDEGVQNLVLQLSADSHHPLKMVIVDHPGHILLLDVGVTIDILSYADDMNNLKKQARPLGVVLTDKDYQPVESQESHV